MRSRGVQQTRKFNNQFEQINMIPETNMDFEYLCYISDTDFTSVIKSYQFFGQVLLRSEILHWSSQGH